MPPGDRDKNRLFFGDLRKDLFPLLAWKRAFFVSFIYLRLKRAVKIKASPKKKINKTNNSLFVLVCFFVCFIDFFCARFNRR